MAAGLRADRATLRRDQMDDRPAHAEIDVEAEARGWSDDRAAMINGKVEGIIAEINRAGNMKRTSGGIRMNARARWGI